MKVTFCSYDDELGMGGPNVWLRRLLPQLQQCGVQVNVLFVAPKNRSLPTVSALQADGVACTLIDRHYTEGQVREILTHLASDIPDVFVPNLVLPAYYAARWVRIANIPTVAILHSDDPYYHAVIENFVCSESPYRVSTVVCVSHFLEQLVDEIGCRGISKQWLPYGAPVPDVFAAEPASCLRLVYAGRLVEEQKQVSLVTRALCKAVRAVPKTEAVIYGDGIARSSVEAIVRAEGKDFPVTMRGHVDSQQIQQELLSCHVFVLLSDYEGLPIALMEAMACGVVPICLRMRSGIPELVEDGVTGLLVDDRNDDFIRAVKRLKEEPGLWKRLSIACRAKIQNEYSDQVCAARWATFLQQLSSTAEATEALLIPAKVDLPLQHPHLATHENRMPHAHILFYRRLRHLVWRAKSRISKQSHKRLHDTGK